MLYHYVFNYIRDIFLLFFSRRIIIAKRKI